MKTLKAWLLRWLGGVSVFECETSRAADKQQLRDEYRACMADMKADHEAAISELIQELNALRNSMPAAVAESQKPGIRVLRNFGEFRAVLEQPQPIRIERKA